MFDDQFDIFSGGRVWFSSEINRCVQDHSITPVQYEFIHVKTLKFNHNCQYNFEFLLSDPNTKVWSFNINEYDLVQQGVGSLKPNVVIGALPTFVLNLLKTAPTVIDTMCLSAIEPTLANALLSFQRDGVCFGIHKKGRCMIADDMGLGKTYQALAIADFYKDDWPLLVCTTAATRDTWATQIRNLLPWIPTQGIVTLTSTSDYFGDAKVLIASYNLMERNADRINDKKFGFVIFVSKRNCRCLLGKDWNFL